MFVSNRSDIHAVAKSCLHAAGDHQQIAGVRMADGTFFSRITAEYPPDLAHALATIIAPLCHHGCSRAATGHLARSFVQDASLANPTTQD